MNFLNILSKKASRKNLYFLIKTELKKIKDDLIQNRKKFPLFNSKLFCKNIEIAFRLMVNNYQNKKNINLTY